MFVPPNANPTFEDPCNPGFWTITGSWYGQTFASLFTGTLLSILSFSLIEKPGIDARVVFKNKYAKK
jgi:hypothetical protein